MSTPIILPQWGMGMNEGQVMKWLKSVGDPIEKGDKLVEIESSKVNSEVEATSDGVLGRIDVQEGKVVNVGTVLGYILVQGETDNDLPVQKSDEVAAQEPDISQSSERIKPQSGKNKIVTPRARRLAKKLNVNIDQVEGTGSGGRITEEDITNFSNKIPSKISLPESLLPVTKTVKLERLRSVIAKRMTESSQIPTVTLTRNVDVTNAVEFQKDLISSWRSKKLRPQYQDLILKATARALSEQREANAHLVGDEIRLLEDINIGVAMAVTDGLIVPVIKNADKKSLLEIALEVRELARQSRSNSIPLEKMSGSSFSVTTLESYNIDTFNPLLNPPEIGILGVGNINVLPLYVDDKLLPRSVGSLNLTFDHRAWDGAPSASFLNLVSKYLSQPSWMDE
ncbi:MAG: hypothetical protein CL780_02985 [Chloroflexi bacterium]|nr:hypothetical protein [Chloroflexota bacterium]|tara:strand:+ start:5366 stop:6556 length:1191 start_codon:yes stop_codon:yes gene_type:complete